MPTNQNAYNSRVTDESLEKKFRDTFKSQGGAELVDDLYASGVIVPVVDFTSAAEGSALRSDLQTAWDFSTGHATQQGIGTTTAITTPGFWKCLAFCEVNFVNSGIREALVSISDGVTSKDVFLVSDTTSNFSEVLFAQSEFTVFLRSGDSLILTCDASMRMTVSYRQIADVSGNLTNPLGFTSS